MDYRAAGGNESDKKRTKKEVLKEKKAGSIRQANLTYTDTISYISLRRAERRVTLFRSLVYASCKDISGNIVRDVPVRDKRKQGDSRLENDSRKEFSPPSSHAVPINGEYRYLLFARPHKSICARV